MLQLKPERLNAEEFQDHPLALCGKMFQADMSGALYWPAETALIVADLSFQTLISKSGPRLNGQLLNGKASAPGNNSYARDDTTATLVRLAGVIDRYMPTTVIALGCGILRSSQAATVGDKSDLPEEALTVLSMLQEDREWIWIIDETTFAGPSPWPRSLGGTRLPSLTVAGLTLRHSPRAFRATHEIAGQLQPAARLDSNGFVFRRPCFVGNGRRLVLPVFGSANGGLNVLDPVFDPLFGHDGMAIWMLGQEGLYPIAPRLLSLD